MRMQLTDGTPVPDDASHAILREDGQQRSYVVLTPEERAKGFVKPVRDSYKHLICGAVTRMGRAIAETYAREPSFYSGTFCVNCASHFRLDEFTWEPDGEPMHVPLQAAWHEKEAELEAERARQRRFDRQKRMGELRAELARLEAIEATEHAA